MNQDTEATTSKKRRVKPSLWRRLFAWGPLGLVILIWFHSLIFKTELKYTNWQLPGRVVIVTSNAGLITLHDMQGLPILPNDKSPELDFSHSVTGIPDGAPYIPSHEWQHSTNALGTRLYIGIPYWWFGMLATLWLALLVWRRKRRGATDCLNCGYDLRGSEGACPECGTVPNFKKVTT